MDVLKPLALTDPVNAIQMAKPRNAHADAEAELDRRRRPQDATVHEEPGGEAWMRREERVSGILRRHVMSMRALSGGNSTSAVAARQKQARGQLR